MAVVEMLIPNLFLLIAIGQLKLLNEMKFVSFNLNQHAGHFCFRTHEKLFEMFSEFLPVPLNFSPHFPLCIISNVSVLIIFMIPHRLFISRDFFNLIAFAVCCCLNFAVNTLLLL